MEFLIQAGRPAVEHLQERDTEELATAIQMVFPMVTEAVILVWNSIPVQLSYKYDLGVLTDDLLSMLQDLLSSTEGTTSVYWASTTFLAAWDLEWASDRLAIAATWESVSGHYEDVLNSRSRIDIGHRQFICEWKILLKTILTGIEQSGLHVSDADGALERMRTIEAAIPAFGHLYKSQP